MAGELGDIRRLTPNRITEAVPQREGRSGKGRQFETLLKREEKDDNPASPRPAEPAPTPHDDDKPSLEAPSQKNLGKVIDYEA